MKRRNFLQSSALLALPVWLGCAFQRGSSIDLTNPDDAVNNSVGRAFLKAQKIGKPLLVIVIPKDENERYKRGLVWGEYLNHGTLTPLALCEVICANEKEISEIVPVSGEPLFFLLENDAGSIKATAHTTELGMATLFDTARSEQDANTDARIKKFSELVRVALMKDSSMIKARASAVEEALGKRAVNQFREAFEGQSSATKDYDTFAAIYVALRDSNPNKIPGFELILEETVQERIVAKKIEGSRWTHSSVCGPDTYEDATEQEREEQGMYRCGMGYVPEKSQRFLTFYTNSSET